MHTETELYPSMTILKLICKLMSLGDTIVRMRIPSTYCGSHEFNFQVHPLSIYLVGRVQRSARYSETMARVVFGFLLLWLILHDSVGGQGTLWKLDYRYDRFFFILLVYGTATSCLMYNTVASYRLRLLPNSFYMYMYRCQCKLTMY